MLVSYSSAIPGIRDEPIDILILTVAARISNRALRQTLSDFTIIRIHECDKRDNCEMTTTGLCFDDGGDQSVNVSRLGFNHEDNRVVAQARVGPVRHGEIREMLNRHAQVGASVPTLVIPVGDMLSMGLV